MTDAFAPLALPASSRPAEGAAFRLKVIPQASATPAFKPLQPVPSPAAGSSNPANHEAHSSSPPKVTLQREGDRVTHIRLECGCGELFELACEY